MSLLIDVQRSRLDYLRDREEERLKAVEIEISEIIGLFLTGRHELVSCTHQETAEYFKKKGFTVDPPGNKCTWIRLPKEETR